MASSGGCGDIGAAGGPASGPVSALPTDAALCAPSLLSLAPCVLSHLLAGCPLQEQAAWMAACSALRTAGQVRGAAGASHAAQLGCDLRPLCSP